MVQQIVTRVTHNASFMLSTANFRTVVFFPWHWLNCFKFGQAAIYLRKYLIFFQISELVSFQPKNSLQLPRPTRNTHKIANKLMTVTFGELNFQSRHDLIGPITKVKAAMSVHSLADVIPVLNFRFESNASIKPTENMFYTQYRKCCLSPFQSIDVSTAFGK